MNHIAALSIAGLATAASAQLEITEAYTGISGPDGSADWIELTNNGSSVVNLGDLFYDDESLDNDAGGDLPNFLLEAGSSIIILVDIDRGEEAEAKAEFAAVWGSDIGVLATGGGSLGGGGDIAAILDASNGIVTSAVTSSALSGELATIDFTGLAPALSVVGVGGAFESAAFDNENFGGTTVTIVGSPVPAPAAMGMMGVAGLAASRRRRA